PGGGSTRIFGIPPEEWAEVQRQLRESQEEIARVFRENFDADEFRRGLRIDTIAMGLDSLSRGMRVFFRDEMDPRIREITSFRVEGSGGNPVAMLSLGARAVAGAEFERMT